MPLEFIFFGFTLAAIVIFHRYNLYISLGGLLLIIILKLIQDSDFSVVDHLIRGEGVLLLNLFGLITGFSILAQIFEKSGIPGNLPAYLPPSWWGGFCLLGGIFVLSAFVDNIAAALIGAGAARVVFKGKVHLAYLAAIIGASNAGGAGSVLGDTTTTLLWMGGVSPLHLLEAYIASGTAFVVFALPASLIQHNYQPIQNSDIEKPPINAFYLLWTLFSLLAAIGGNQWLGIPALGLWVAIISGGLVVRIPGSNFFPAAKGSFFLLALVVSASLMPVKYLPPPSPVSTFGMGLFSAIFDNIPLTRLCLAQGGYNWALLAYAVGFGGSILWFGSSAGVAVSSLFPECRNTLVWIKKSWMMLPAFLTGFFMLLWMNGSI